MTDTQTSAQLKILLVDDNRIIRQLLKLTFADSRFKLFEAECGEQALAIIADEKPDYVFLDVKMPGELDGLQVCQLVKASDETRHCKIILLTALSQQEGFDSGIQAGADFCISKPFSPAELLSLVCT